jgi:hypothetical protein
MLVLIIQLRCCRVIEQGFGVRGNAISAVVQSITSSAFVLFMSELLSFCYDVTEQ